MLHTDIVDLKIINMWREKVTHILKEMYGKWVFADPQTQLTKQNIFQHRIYSLWIYLDTLLNKETNRILSWYLVHVLKVETYTEWLRYEMIKKIWK